MMYDDDDDDDNDMMYEFQKYRLMDLAKKELGKNKKYVKHKIAPFTERVI